MTSQNCFAFVFLRVYLRYFCHSSPAPSPGVNSHNFFSEAFDYFIIETYIIN